MSKRKAPKSEKNEDIVEALIELAEYEKNVERNRFKEKAYRKAANTIAGLDKRLKSGDDAKALPGVGDKIAKKIDEILETGKLRKLENIRADDKSTAINLLTRVSGIGPAKAKELVDAGIMNLDDLEKHKDKLNHAQLIGLKHFHDFEVKIPREEVKELFESVKKVADSIDEDYMMEVCGSYRRGAKSSGDVDILLCHSEFKHSDKHHGDLLHRLIKKLTEKELVTDKISEGDTKFMGVAKLPKHKHFRQIIKMSTRSSRTSQRELPSSTPKERPPSPLSPTKISRTEEKRALGNLNDRLASYIDKVRSLEQDKGRLQNQVSTIEEVKTKEIISLRSNYDRELASARKALDETSKANAKLEIDAKKLKTRNDELEMRNRQLENEATKASNQIAKLENENHVLGRDLGSAQNQLNELRPENKILKEKLEDARQKLEDETIQRIDAQNRLLTQKEESEFNSKYLEEQLNETRMRKQIEIEEVDSRAQTQYEEKLSQSLKELRDSYEQQLADNRTAFGSTYDKKITDLQSKLQKEREEAATAVQEMKEYQTKMEAMTSKMNQVEINSRAMEDRIKDLTSQLETLGKDYRSDMAKKDREIDYINEQLTGLTKEYQELLEIKVALDMEISAYQKLLESEEARMGLSPSPDSERPRKRKRIDIDESYTGIKMNTTFSQAGDLLIKPLDEQKNCIQVENTGETDVNLGGYQLLCVSDGVETNYKFTRSHKIAAASTISVYSSDSGVEHSPASGVLVMKTGAWSMADEVKVQLVNKEGEEMAARDTNWQQEVVRGSQSFMGDIDRTASSTKDEKCCIM